MRTPLGPLITVAVIFLIDLYCFQGLKAVSLSASPKTRTIIYSCFWGLTALFVTLFLVLISTQPDYLKPVRTYVFALLIGMVLAKITAVFFFLIDDIRRLLQWIVMKIVQQ